MSRTFRTVDYQATLDVSVPLGDCVPQDHLASFVVDTITQLGLSAIYAQYGVRGGEPYAPETLLGLPFFGYATGVFSSRKIERATYESAPFRFVASNLHPDHDTLANFRKSFLSCRGLDALQTPCFGAPGMGAELGVEVSHGGCNTEPLAESKGVTVRWGLEEAGGKAASR